MELLSALSVGADAAVSALQAVDGDLRHLELDNAFVFPIAAYDVESVLAGRTPGGTAVCAVWTGFSF